MMSLENAGVLCVKNTFFDEVSAFSSELEMRQCKSCFCRPSSDSDLSELLEDASTPSLVCEEAEEEAKEEEEPIVDVCNLRTWSGGIWEAACTNQRRTHRAAGDDWMQFMDDDSELQAEADISNEEQHEDEQNEDELPTCHLRTLSWSSHHDGLHDQFGKMQRGHSCLKSIEAIHEAPCTFSEAAQNVLGQVWELSQTAQGCREVQAALEEPGSDEAQRVLCLELKTHVAEGLFCPYANFVLQKCVTLLAETDLEFFFEELMAEGPEKASKHKFGCRVTQRLASKCPATWGVAIGEALLQDFQNVASHPYGNYVVQHLLETGTESTRASLMNAVLENLRFLVADTFGAAVVAGALKSALGAARVVLARALVSNNDVLVALALSRHGHGSVLASLDLVPCEESRTAILLLQQSSASVSATKFGRAVLAALQTRGL